MTAMFEGARAYNQPMNDWDVSNITTMQNMFLDYYKTEFNQPLKDWEVSKVTNMNGMFLGAAAFNQSLT
jgi:hypothetical protein